MRTDQREVGGYSYSLIIKKPLTYVCDYILGVKILSESKAPSFDGEDFFVLPKQAALFIKITYYLDTHVEVIM